MSSQYIPYSSRGGAGGGGGGAVSSVNGGTGAILIEAGPGITVTTTGATNIIGETPPSETQDGNTGSAITVDWSAGSAQAATVTANCTFTLVNGVAGGSYVLRLTEGTGAPFTATWGSNISWPQGTPPTLSNATDIDLITFYAYAVGPDIFYLGNYSLAYGSSAPPFVPTDVSGLQLWLDGNDVLNGSNPPTGTKFATWHDKSTHGNNYTQASSANQFSWTSSGVNGNGSVASVTTPAETFASISHNFITSGNPVAVYLVFQGAGSTSVSTSNLFADSGPGGAGSSVLQISGTGTLINFFAPGGTGWNSVQYSTSTLMGSVPYILGFQYNGGSTSSGSSFSILIDGTALTPTASPGPANGNPGTFLGGDGDTSDAGFQGFLCEYLIYSAIPNSSDNSKILTYLSTKWS